MTDRYGYCKRSKAWVLRDAMLGLHVKAFGADGREEHLTIRLAPSAHADFMDRLRALTWENNLRTREDLEAGSEPIIDVMPIAPTDTALWYLGRHVDDDEAIVAKTMVRSLSKAQSLGEIEQQIRQIGGKVRPSALFLAAKELKKRIPRWDHEVLTPREEQILTDREVMQAHTIEALVLSADLDQVVVLELGQFGHEEFLKVHVIDHGLSQLAHQRLGRLKVSDSIY